MTTREEHLQWAKDRAIEYVNRGDLVNALASFASDCGNHEGTAPIADGTKIGMLLIMEGARCVQNDDREGMRRLILGFN